MHFAQQPTKKSQMREVPRTGARDQSPVATSRTPFQRFVALLDHSGFPVSLFNRHPGESELKLARATERDPECGFELVHGARGTRALSIPKSQSTLRAVDSTPKLVATPAKKTWVTPRWRR